MEQTESPGVYLRGGAPNLPPAAFVPWWEAATAPKWENIVGITIFNSQVAKSLVIPGVVSLIIKL